MAAQSYTLRRFQVPSSLVGTGNYLANKLTQFFSLNPTLSVVSLTCNWREGRSRSDTLYFNLLYRGGGSQGRMWASQFAANATQTCEDLAQRFFDYNQTYVPVQTVLLSRPDTMPRNRILLVIYATQNNVQVPCLLNAPIGIPAADVAEAAYGTFYDNQSVTRPGLPALNLGNATWPNGGANLLVRALGSNPDLCAWGGIAPCCYDGIPLTPPTPAEPDLYCEQCIDPNEVTITYTTITTTTESTTTTTMSTTTTTTSTTSTTSTTTTTTTTTTSSTTSTAFPTPCIDCGGSLGTHNQAASTSNSASGEQCVNSGTCTPYSYDTFPDGPAGDGCVWRWSCGDAIGGLGIVSLFWYPSMASWAATAFSQTGTALFPTGTPPPTNRVRCEGGRLIGEATLAPATDCSGTLVVTFGP